MNLFRKETIEETAVEEVRQVAEAPEAVQETVEEVIERPYTLRKLKDGDLYPLLQLIRKCGLKDFKEVFVQVANGHGIEEIGAMVLFDMADKIIENICGSVGDEIYEFYSNLSGLSVDEIKEMEFGTLPLMIYDSFAEVKNTGFFKVLSKLL